MGPPSHGLKISGARAQSARMRVKNSSCADCFYPFLLESLDLSMKSGPGIREFNRLYKELDDLYHNLALRQGLSDSASIILYALYLLGDGCLQRDICDLSYISKQTINSSIRRLEQDGYLYLQPGRGRDMHICLTPEGRRLVEEKAAPVAAMEERAFSGMPQEDQQALLRLTHAYLARLRAEAGRIL